MAGSQLPASGGARRDPARYISGTSQPPKFPDHCIFGADSADNPPNRI